MKHRLLILYMLWGIMGIVPAFADNNQLDSLLNVLDRTIKNHQVYKSQRELRIKKIKSQLAKTLRLSKERYLLNERLYEEYKPYSCDSTIAYLDNNIELATAMGNASWVVDSKLKLSYLLASSGMYMESIDLLNGIDKKKIPTALKIQYYMCYDHAVDKGDHLAILLQKPKVIGIDPEPGDKIGFPSSLRRGKAGGFHRRERFQIRHPGGADFHGRFTVRGHRGY